MRHHPDPESRKALLDASEGQCRYCGARQHQMHGCDPQDLRALVDSLERERDELRKAIGARVEQDAAGVARATRDELQSVADENVTLRTRIAELEEWVRESADDMRNYGEWGDGKAWPDRMLARAAKLLPAKPEDGSDG